MKPPFGVLSKPPNKQIKGCCVVDPRRSLYLRRQGQQGRGVPRVEHGVTQDMVFGFKLLHLQDEFSVFVLVGENSPRRIHSVMFHIYIYIYILYKICWNDWFLHGANTFP